MRTYLSNFNLFIKALTSHQKWLIFFISFALVCVVSILSFQLRTSYIAEIRQSIRGASNLSFAIEQYTSQTFNNADYALIKIKEHE